MLKLKRDLAGLALLATLFAGCQTAPKNNAVTDASSYGVTGEDLDSSYYGDSAARGVAGIGDPIFKELFNAFREEAVRTAFTAMKRDVSSEFVTYVNRNSLRIGEVDALKDAKFAAAERDWKAAVARGEKSERPRRGIADRLGEEDLNGIDAVQQAKIAKAFMDEKKLTDLPGLSKVYSKVDAQVKALAKVDPKAKALTGEMQAKLLTEQAANSKNIDGKIASNVEMAKLEKEVDAILEKMKAGDPNFKGWGPEARDWVKSARLDTAKIYRYSDGKLKNFTVQTCDNLTPDALKRYSDLLHDIRQELDDVAKAKGIDPKFPHALPCKNIPEITAWIAAKFQAGLGRTGLTAFSAVEEMSICHYLAPETAPASRKIAAANKGVVETEVRCE